MYSHLTLEELVLVDILRTKDNGAGVDHVHIEKFDISDAE